MSIQSVLAPLFVQVVLTFALLFWSGSVRTAATRRGEVKRSDDGLRESTWPAPIQRLSNAYQSQLELPVLFYVLTILAVLARKADLLFVLLAWVFVALRLLHAYVHVTNSYLAQRGVLFMAGAIVLAVMWVFFMLHVLLGLG
jgi:hypothetical protein